MGLYCRIDGYASVAQWIEHLTTNQKVGGSTPSGRVFFYPMDKTQQTLFMKKAFNLARSANANSEVPVGAVIVSDGKIIASGYNSLITRHDPSAHAEIIALREAGQRLGNYRLTGVDMYVTLEPCCMCYTALVQARIGNLYYGADDPKTGIFSTGSFDLIKEIFNHKIGIHPGIMAEESAELLKDFFKKRRGAGAVERGGLENR